MEHPTLKLIVHSLVYFFLAGFCEIGGGYFVWIWQREGASFYHGMLGGALLFLYGVVPTLQKAHFHRIYGAYGGIFVIMSLAWGWVATGIRPDVYDFIGVALVMFGTFVMYYWPRKPIVEVRNDLP